MTLSEALNDMRWDLLANLPQTSHGGMDILVLPAVGEGLLPPFVLDPGPESFTDIDEMLPYLHWVQRRTGNRHEDGLQLCSSESLLNEVTVMRGMIISHNVVVNLRFGRAP